MSDGTQNGARPTDKVGRVLYRLSELFALFGGLVVAAMAVIILINVVWRASGLTSISGIVDLIELATSTAVFPFLPYCQLMRENVIVDFVMSKAPTRAKTVCDAIGNLLYLSLGVLFSWRMIYGGYDLYRYNETFTTIGFPRWLSFPYAGVCMLLLIAVTAYTFWRSIAETKAGRFFDPSLNDSGPELKGVD